MSSTFARRASLLLAGGGVYAGASGLAYLYFTAGREDQEETNRQLLSSSSTSSSSNHNGNHCSSFVTNPNRKEKFDELAARYDALINNDERFMMMNLLRRSLLYWHAKGTVLEMAAGTGRNCSYYPASTVDRVVMTDTSEAMLQQAKEKVRNLQKGGFMKEEDRKPKFAILRADGNAALDFADNSFDTVVDTFGLCSFDDPVAALQQMERVCKPDGKILLLEHGRSKTWNWISDYLDKTAERHAKNWGCVYNRDLDRIIKESGLLLDVLHTWHFGTTYYMVCRPRQSKSAIERTAQPSNG